MRRVKYRSGFTLIELIASAVLASLMMLGLMSVTWSTVRETRMLREASIRKAPATQLARQLRTDLHNARGMVIGRSSLVLHGFLGRQSRTGLSALTPARIQYRRQMVGGRGVLVRNVEGKGSEAVWLGFGSLRIDPLADLSSEDELLPEPEAGGLPEVPPKFRVTLFDDQGRVVWREVIHHHAT